MGPGKELGEVVDGNGGLGTETLRGGGGGGGGGGSFFWAGGGGLHILKIE